MVDSRTLTEGRDWIYDCFEDAPADLTDSEVLRAISRHYEGGLSGFMADTRALLT